MARSGTGTLASARAGAGGAALAAPPVAEAIGVSKRFGASQALDDVSLVIPAGDSRALVGRNGAGKSTLVGVLTGLLAPDAGQVRLAGEPAPGLADRQRWRERVACVYQKSTVIPTLTVAENLFLNAQPTVGGGFVAWAALRRQAERVLEDWGLEVDVDLDAERLTVEQRQIVEIARALLQGTRFIILDEPTAQLEGREVAGLFERIVRLQEGGVTFLYISHHLEEIYEVCRSVTVLRDGQVVANAPLETMPKERVVAAMVGDAVRGAGGRGRRPLPTAGVRVPCLEVRGLCIEGAALDLSFEVAAGETVGLAGLAGSGKEEVGDAIAGLITPSAGEIRVAGTPLRPGLVADARRKGVGYVPRDRHRRGIVPQLSLAENLTLTIPERLGPAGLVRPAERDREAARLVRSLEIVAASTEQPIAELSGGNQQKAVMGRALASEPKVLVVAYPTQGVDIASKEALFGILEQARATGTGVLVVSDDLDELVICDRVLVIFRGTLVGEFGAGWRDHELVAAIEGLGRDG
jgi:simple sugar transport system ATP-binding protein